MSRGRTGGVRSFLAHRAPLTPRAVKSKYSTWLSALKANPDDGLKHDYVRLLVMGLNNPVPVCPFNEYPPEEIEPLDGDWMDVSRNMFARDNCRPETVNPPIMTAVSDDRCEFAACQRLARAAGVQCFYARSDEPLYEWNFKYDSTANPPDEAARARPLDWERSLAGIRKASKYGIHAAPGNAFTLNGNYVRVLSQGVVVVGHVRFQRNVK